jgi:uncharacterized protein YdeI (BOF family)
MKALTGFVGLLAIGLSVQFGVPNAFADQSKMKEGTQGIQSQTAQEQQADQERLKKQNMQEQQRLQAPSMKERAGEVPYTENQPIGGQKDAGPADFPQPAFPFVKGQLMQIEGEFYVLRDAEGKEVRVHVDKSTKMTGAANVGDILEVQRTLQGHAVMIKPASGPLASPPSSASSGAGSGSSERIVKDEQVTLSGAKQAVRGEVLKIEGDNYVIKDGHGNEVRLTVNPNTRLLCSQAGSISGMLPAPSASDKPDLKGQPQDLAKTNEQQGSEVGPGTKPAKEQASGTGKAQASTKGDCAFKKGDMIEAEISDMGAATFIKTAGRPQPGQPLP